MSPAPYAVTTPQARLLAVCAAEIGYHEKASNKDLDSKTDNAGSANYTKYARDLDAIGNIYNGRKNGYDWCDVFVDAMFIMTFGVELAMKLLCQPYKGCGAGCGYSMSYYQAKGQFHKTGPQPGDQAFFGDNNSTWHTGLVEKAQGGYVYIIEGNTGNGSVQVQRCVYSLNYKYIKGYGRPDWSLVSATNLSGWTGYAVYEGPTGLYCRSYPRSGAVLREFAYGESMTIVEELNGWGLAEDCGWVSLDHVSKTGPAPAPAPSPKPEGTPAPEPDGEGVSEVKTYTRLNDVPAWYQPSVRKAMELGALTGGADPDPSSLEDNVLNVSEDLCRMLTVLDRLGLVNKAQ